MSNPYDYAIDPTGDATANKVLRMVGHDKNVLELGTAGGVMTRALKSQGCRITGVEYEAELAAQAQPSCETMLVGNLENLELEKQFGTGRFDVVLAADVLEHLRNPEKILQSLRPLLAEGGYCVISLPNIAFSGLLAGLIQGHFQYKEKGLLDQTHLRFFTRSSIEDMLLTQGWMPIEWQMQRVNVRDTEFLLDWNALPAHLKEALQNRPYDDVYQFIVKAVPARQEAWQTALHEKYMLEHSQLTQLQDAHTRLESAHKRATKELDLVNQAFSEAREIIARFEKQIQAQDATLSEQAQKIESLQELAHKSSELQTEVNNLRKHPRLHPITKVLHRLLPPN